MVDSDPDVTAEPDEGRPKRWWPIVVASVLVVIVALGVATYVAASHYQPIFQGLDGEAGSQVLASDGSVATFRVAGDAANPRDVWTEPIGTFRVEVLVSLNNFQRFGITIDKVTAPPNPSGTSNVQVFFDSKGNGVGVYGYKGGPAFKPSSLSSKGNLTLAVHWTQQCVPSSAQSSATTYTSVPVEYTFLGFRHTVTVPIEPLTIVPRATC
jgi:hypothetical protein